MEGPEYNVVRLNDPAPSEDTTGDCEATIIRITEKCVVFRFFFPDLNGSMDVILPKDSEDYKKDPELFAREKAPEVKKMVIRDMSEAAQGPKDWWQVLVDVREAEKRKSEEATFMALRKQLEDSDNFAASPGRVIGEAVSKNQKAIKGGRQIGSSNTSGSWNTEMEPDNCAELLKGDNQAMLEENTKVPQKKKKNKLKSKKKKKDYVGTTISVVNTSAGSDEHGEPQFRESSKREVVPFEPSVFTFDLKDEPNKDPNEDCSSGKDMKVEVDNTSSPTVDADSGPQQKGKCHRRVSKSVAQAKVHEELHDSSRNAAVERLRGEALPMSLEDARGKRTTLREERSASIQFLRQRTLSRGSSVSGSRPASPPQRDSRPKVDMILLEDVDKITHSPTSQRNPSVTTEVAPPDEGHWQTVTKQKPKKQPNNKSMANKQGVPRMKTSRKDRQSEVVANFSAREQPSKASRTSLATVSQGVNLGQAVASSRLVETLSDQGPKIPQQAKMDRAEGNIPSQGRPNAAATAPRNGLGVIEELTLEDLEDPMHTEPIYPVSDNTARLTGSEMLIRAINAWQDQSDNEFENTTDRQALLRDPLFHSANNEAYVFHDRPFVVPAHLVNEDNLRNGTCFPNLQILLGDPYTGEIPEQVWLDPATPPRLCKCTVLEGNRALVNYEPSIHRMIIHPMMNPRPDHRNNPYHPDFLPPSKLAEYQAYEQAGYPVYRFDRVTFECNLSSCRKVIRDHVRSTVLCNGCGPYSDVRYCSKKHLFEDCKTHWQTCGLTPSRIVWDDWTMPSRYKRRYPAIKDIHGRTTPERQRQQAYSIHHPASDYVIFNDWQDKQNSGEECRGTGEPIVFLIFRDGDPKKDMFNRLLNIAFFDHHHANIIIYLYRLIRTACRRQNIWTPTLDHQLSHQLFHEFFYDPRHLVTPRNDCRGDWTGIIDVGCTPACKRELAHNGIGAKQFCEKMEAQHWILRVWRRQHAEKVWVRRMVGVGFKGVSEEGKRGYVMGEGWDGWGMEGDEICA